MKSISNQPELRECKSRVVTLTLKILHLFKSKKGEKIIQAI